MNAYYVTMMLATQQTDIEQIDLTSYQSVLISEILEKSKNLLKFPELENIRQGILCLGELSQAFSHLLLRYNSVVQADWIKLKYSYTEILCQDLMTYFLNFPHLVDVLLSYTPIEKHIAENANYNLPSKEYISRELIRQLSRWDQGQRREYNEKYFIVFHNLTSPHIKKNFVTTEDLHLSLLLLRRNFQEKIITAIQHKEEWVLMVPHYLMERLFKVGAQEILIAENIRQPLYTLQTFRRLMRKTTS